MSDTYSTYLNQNLELKYRLRLFFFSRKCWLSSMDIALRGILPTTIKSHVVKIVITWSISPDENNNIGLVYINPL